MMEEIDFFDHIIDDLLDFPEDNNQPNNTSTVATHHHDAHSHSFPTHAMWPDFPSSSHHFSSSDLSAQLAVPYEDIVQMEWLSTFVEDSFSGGSMTTTTIDEHKQDSSSASYANHVNYHHSNQFHSSSPVSVLESSSSCSVGKIPSMSMTLSPEPPAPGPGRYGRARSKRPRPPPFNPRLAMQLISPTESIAESRPLIKIPKPKKKSKVSPPLPLSGHEKTDELQSQESSISQVSVRKCKHCEITKTPQWRAGPMGPKTLCNACGVRYKSGRLFPEYRPAASPTFVAALHSNSHKKVVEMRIKGVTYHPETEVLIPNANPILLLDYI